MSGDAVLVLAVGGGVLALAMILLVLWDHTTPSSAPAINDDTLKQIWLERAQKDSADYGLSGIRAVAGKWAASAAAVLGVLGTVAVVAGPSDLAKEVGGEEAQIAAGMILVAGALAAIATLLAGLAEQGTPVSMANDDAAAYKALIKARAERAALELFWSRVLVAVAVALIMGAAGVAWLTALTGPKADEPGQSALVVGDNGAQCGTLVRLNGSVSLKVGQDTPSPLPAGARVTLVDDCP